MPYFLRKIKKLSWISSVQNNNTDMPSDVLVDFNSTNNKISLWEILDDKSNLCRVVIAISCNMQKIKHFEYVIINSECILNKGFKINQSKGTTADIEANNSWHYDATELTGDSLLQIAKLFHSKSEPQTLLADEVKECLKECIEFISLKNVSNQEMKKYLEDFKAEHSS